MAISEFGLFMTKKDWTAMFMASLALIAIVSLTLLGKVATWVLLALLFLFMLLSIYMAWFKKYPYSDTELEDMLGSLKDDWFGGKKK